ncbi:MAG TPA: STAS/SEC14 domain-containing protein [Rhizomicrobium sp.]|nr:STAS/SEC14 domain-containing protein [Rhizomicrobium sp.]
MLELVADLPQGAVGVRARGRITAADYETVLVPAVEAALKTHDTLDIYYEIGREYDGIDAGAVVEDFELGMRELAHWRRLALVTDVTWIRQAARLFAFLVHGEVRVFAVRDAAAARTWIAAR